MAEKDTMRLGKLMLVAMGVILINLFFVGMCYRQLSPDGISAGDVVLMAVVGLPLIIMLVLVILAAIRKAGKKEE